MRRGLKLGLINNIISGSASDGGNPDSILSILMESAPSDSTGFRLLTEDGNPINLEYDGE